MIARLVNTSRITLVLALALALLLYVGYGEAYKTYPLFQFDKIKSLGEIIRDPLRTFLGAGLPLNQFPGFSPLTTPLLESEESVSAIGVTDKNGETVFLNSRSDAEIVSGTFRNSFLSKKVSGYILEENDTHYRVSLNIRSKFEDIGYLWLLCPKEVIDGKIKSDFFPLLILFAIILICYGLTVFFTEKRWGEYVRRWLSISYGICFGVMSLSVIWTLINIYTDGILGKTEALADSLSQRINKAIELGLDISDFSGLDSIFTEYKENNPDTSFVSLTVNDQITIHTDPKLNGTGLSLQPRPDHFEYKARFQEKTVLPARTDEYTLEYIGRLLEQLIKKDLSFGIHVGIPKKLVFGRIWRNAKNFVVLFVASGFMAALFLNLLVTFHLRDQSGGASGDIQEKLQLDLANPIFFLSIFMEGLNVSFLPQYFREMATATGPGPGMASALFTVFFAAYALVLVPAGRYAESHGVKKLMMLGAVLSSAGMVLMMFVHNYYMMCLIRFLCGTGQGMLFIGVQSYILKVASQKRKTQAAAIIVFGYNGGMISGSAIGALLVINLKTEGIFLLAAIIGLFLFWYVWKLLPEVVPVAVTATAEKKTNLFANLSLLFKDIRFVKTILLVGITTKAVLTGVAIFAMPLLLAGLGYAQEDIGQIFMFYAAGVLITSRIVSQIADRIGRTGNILFWGTQGSGLGLMLIGLIGWQGMTSSSFPYADTAIVICGMLIPGLSHGFINAPIVTHISNTKAAGKLGAASATSIYRFLERLGHVAGPIAVSQLLSLNQNSPMTITWIGAATVICGLIFVIGSSDPAPSAIA